MLPEWGLQREPNKHLKRRLKMGLIAEDGEDGA